MDGGSSINILYYDTFNRMKLLDRQLIPTETVFHGIVPGKSAKPIGKIYLEVAFGTLENYRSEILPFEVVDLKSPYHALFGRPAYFKFMARSCYVYLKLKMPGPKGVITVNGSRQMALECEREKCIWFGWFERCCFPLLNVSNCCLLELANSNACHDANMR